ncbi:MAG: hypothetical protein HC923_07905 [Myxococcales bacterium]|nr:hypothetical protein [Myxococcales bacterium]
MTEAIEFEGSTEAEAVEKAATAMGVAAQTIDYTVVDEGSAGVFGLGFRPVKIRVRSEADEAGELGSEYGDEMRSSRRGPAPEKAAQAGEVVRDILSRMNVRARVEVRDEDEHIVVVLSEEEGGTDIADTLGRSRPQGFRLSSSC